MSIDSSNNIVHNVLPSFQVDGAQSPNKISETKSGVLNGRIVNVSDGAQGAQAQANAANHKDSFASKLLAVGGYIASLPASLFNTVTSSLLSLAEHLTISISPAPTQSQGSQDLRQQELEHIGAAMMPKSAEPRRANTDVVAKPNSTQSLKSGSNLDTAVQQIGQHLKISTPTALERDFLAALAKESGRPGLNEEANVPQVSEHPRPTNLTKSLNSNVMEPITQKSDEPNPDLDALVKLVSNNAGPSVDSLSAKERLLLEKLARYVASSK